MTNCHRLLNLGWLAGRGGGGGGLSNMLHCLMSYRLQNIEIIETIGMPCNILNFLNLFISKSVFIEAIEMIELFPCLVPSRKHIKLLILRQQQFLMEVLK